MATLAVFMFGSQVFAYPLKHDITIFDKTVSSDNAWYNRGTADGIASEDNETEPGTMTAQAWDLEGFYLGDETRGTGNTLYMVGGYNFKDGYEGYASGAIFFGTTGVPKYGEPLGGGGNTAVPNVWGYDYAVVLDFSSLTGPVGHVYKLTSNSSLRTIWFGPPIYYGKLDNSNPYQYVSDGTYLGTIPIIFSVETTDSLVDSGYPTGPAGADGNETHYVIGFDLTAPGLGGYGEPGANWYVHYTYGCGNDNLMGSYAAPNPVPASVLLLGSGLLGLIGIGRRKRAK